MLDRDGDGNIDRLYVGDLGGNIWRVDVADKSPSKWVVTELASLSATKNPRKFFYPPDVVPMSTFDAVMAASGDREHPLASNAASNVVNRFYSLRDTNTGTSVTGTWTPITESGLVDATNAVYSGGGSGFYVTLQNGGEKAVNAPLTVAGYTYFGTNEPANPKNNPNMCYPNLGIARGYAINFMDGTGMNSNRFVQFDGGGMPPSPIFGMVNLPTASGGSLITPVLIGAGNQLGLVGGNNTSSLGSQKVVPPGTGKRKRTYWYIDGVK
jgi:type IV pilus assembly protein PilY1